MVRGENNRNGVVVEIKQTLKKSEIIELWRRKKEGGVSKILPFVLEKIGCLRSH